jgi:radical SAM superfamily enzyme YgiQ (UPF0313 family)
MYLNEIYYSEPVYRPPSEAGSLLIQVTEGCTFKCTFCISNSKKFKIREIVDIKRDMDTSRRIYGIEVRKMFFLDGNAMVIPFQTLLDITKYAQSLFPKLNRIGTYAHAKDIIGKTDEELKLLHKAGLKIVYIGIESGNSELLQQTGKNVTADQIVAAFHKCFRAGITPSGTIILGLAGNENELAQKHMTDTADLVNRASPKHIMPADKIPVWYISCLALMMPEGSDIAEDTNSGKFIPQTATGILNEMKILIENISDDVKGCVFRSNHASNYLPIKGRLSRDREKILGVINKGLENSNYIRPEYMRGL